MGGDGKQTIPGVIKQKMTSKPQIILAGGGHAHTLIIQKWAMKPTSKPDANITLITNDSTQLYSGMVPGLIAGIYKRNDIEINIRQLCETCNIELIIANIDAIDIKSKAIEISGRPQIRYEILSINVGSETDNQRHREGVKIRPIGDALEYISQETDDHSTPFRVIGGGYAGMETVLALRTRWPNRQLELEVWPSQLNRFEARILMERGIKIVNSGSVSKGPMLLCTGSKGPEWLKASQLPVNRKGRVITNQNLEVIGLPGIFAVGDCGIVQGQERPPSGVWAIKAAKILEYNLKAKSSNKRLKKWYPQKTGLQLIGDQAGRAWGQKGQIRLTYSKLWWRLKQLIDRTFMKKFAPKQKMKPGGKTMDCRGCAAKLSGQTLQKALIRSQIAVNAEDAAEILKGEQALFQSVDGFPAIVSDAWLNGRITTLHACSDLWASGARTINAMAVITLPKIGDIYQQDLLSSTLEGIRSALSEQNAQLVGGHTMVSRREPDMPWSMNIEVSLSVNGVTKKPWTKGGIQRGDQLFVSRQIGTGVLFAAAMYGSCPARWIDEALEVMSTNQYQLVRELQELNVKVNACTDITGFGLLGHLMEMINAEETELNGVEIEPGNIPAYNGAIELISKGYCSTLAPANRSALKNLGKTIRLKGDINQNHLELIVDPQTCGPLLIACNQEDSNKILKQKHWVKIGQAF